MVVVRQPWRTVIPKMEKAEILVKVPPLIRAVFCHNSTAFPDIGTALTGTHMEDRGTAPSPSSRNRNPILSDILQRYNRKILKKPFLCKTAENRAAPAITGADRKDKSRRAAFAVCIPRPDLL